MKARFTWDLYMPAIPPKKTYKMMIQGALSFAGILKRLTGYDPESFVIAKPFHYYVSHETMMDLNAIHEHISKC